MAPRRSRLLESPQISVLQDPPSRNRVTCRGIPTIPARKERFRLFLPQQPPCPSPQERRVPNRPRTSAVPHGTCSSFMLQVAEGNRRMRPAERGESPVDAERSPVQGLHPVPPTVVLLALGCLPSPTSPSPPPVHLLAALHTPRLRKRPVASPCGAPSVGDFDENYWRGAHRKEVSNHFPAA